MPTSTRSGRRRRPGGSTRPSVARCQPSKRSRLAPTVCRNVCRALRASGRRALSRTNLGGTPARRPVSRVLCRGLRHGDGHPSGAAGCPTAHAADPRAGQRASPPGEPGLRPPIWPCSGWSLPRFTPAPGGRHRHCGTGPRLAADGRYPPPCAGELGLSSRRPVARPTRDRPAASLACRYYPGTWPTPPATPRHARSGALDGSACSTSMAASPGAMAAPIRSSSR